MTPELEFLVDEDAEAEKFCFSFGETGEGQTDRQAAVVEAGGDAESREVGDRPRHRQPDARPFRWT